MSPQRSRIPERARGIKSLSFTYGFEEPAYRFRYGSWKVFEESCWRPDNHKGSTSPLAGMNSHSGTLRCRTWWSRQAPPCGSVRTLRRDRVRTSRLPSKSVSTKTGHHKWNTASLVVLELKSAISRPGFGAWGDGVAQTTSSRLKHCNS